MMTRRFRIFLPALLLVACGGKMAMPGSSTHSNIEELQKRVIELQQRAAVTEVELRGLRDEVAHLRSVKSVKSAAEETGLAAATEPVEQVGWQPPMHSAEIEEVDLPPVAPPLQSDGSASDDFTPLPPPSSEAQLLYDRGYTLYHQGRYEDAEKIFREMLGTYRKNELSDNAWYWIGESRWARGEVRLALDAFRETLESYPGGNKTPDALLKIGQSLERLGDADGAREAYRQLVARYPATAAAAVAEDLLAGSD